MCKTVLIAIESPRGSLLPLHASMVQQILELHNGNIYIHTCETAGKVLEWVEQNGLPDFLILSDSLDYGTTIKLFQATTDPEGYDCGARLLTHLRAMETNGIGGKMHRVAFITDSFIPYRHPLPRSRPKDPGIKLFLMPFSPAKLYKWMFGRRY